MKLSIALSPRKSVFAPLLFTGDLMLGIRKAAELGYQGVEINLRDVDAEAVDEIVASTAARGLSIVALGTGQSYLVDGLSVISPDAAVREALVARLKRHIEFAARVGAQITMGGVFGAFAGDQASRKAQYEGAVDVMRRLADHARREGVVIAVEPINRYETNFLNTVDQAIAFLGDVGAAGIGLLLDSFHMNIEESDIGAAIAKAGTLVSHVHLADSNRLPPGMGHFDFPAMLSALHGIGYSGFLSGEFLPLPDDERAAASNIAYLHSLEGEKAKP